MIGKMVQNTDIEEKVITNGVVKTEENEEATQSAKTNGFASDSDESDEDDYLDHLLMLPRLDVNTSDRNKHLVSKTLLDFCTAIENRKEYQKIKQELLMNVVPIECKQEADEVPVIVSDVEQIMNGNESPPPQIESNEVNEVIPETEAVPECRRQSIRLKKAQFGKNNSGVNIFNNNSLYFSSRTCASNQ